MDFWSTAAIGLQILLLVAGWLLFQQAKSDLTARAVEAPVLAELRALENTSRALIEQLRNESGDISERLELQCSQAISALNSLEQRIQIFHSAEPMRISGLGTMEPPTVAPSERRRFRRTDLPDTTFERDDEALAAVRQSPPDPYSSVRQFAANGMTTVEIARKTGITAGEVDLILGLSRSQGTPDQP